MTRIRFFKPYTVWLPTLWGLLLTFLILTLITYFGLRNLGNFLAYQKPIHSNILVVDGWMSEENLQLAAKYVKKNNYEFVITSGGPIKHKLLNPQHDYYAEQATFILKYYGTTPDKIITLPTPASAQNRTFLSAVTVRDWLDKHNPNYRSLDLFTSGVHSRRSHLLYETAFDDDKQIGVIVAPPIGYQLDQWWNSSTGAKGVLMEVISLVWTVCCFDPGEKGSHQEKWGIY